MEKKKQLWPTIGLIFITFLSAVQYFFLRNVPDTVSNFSFVCITNLIGVLILGAARINKVVKIKKKTLLKGVIFAVELTGFGFFLLLGSRHLDAVIISSTVSLYFVFITPMLLIMKKKVNFFSGIATFIAIIALLLMFGADTDALFSSTDMIYLIIADLFFAAYVVSVSVFGQDEDPSQLTFSQMLFAALFGLIGWGCECFITGTPFTIPTQKEFWISAIFIGIFIRAVYGLIQITAQKRVSALKTSLIFSSEIIITLVTNPIMCKILGTEYTPATLFQTLGGLLLIFATLMVDEAVMTRFGYGDVRELTKIDMSGKVEKRNSVAKKVILTTLTFALVTLAFSTVTFLSAIHFIRTSSVENSKNIGDSASATSSEAMMEKLEESIQSQANDKALMAEQKLSAYSDASQYAASYATSLYQRAAEYPEREVDRPHPENAGKWVMMRTLASEDITYEDVRKTSALLGNMEDVFAPIIENNENIATIYIGTEDGLLVSYDTHSDDGDPDNESYFEFRERPWYDMGRNADGYQFTEAEQDYYGRGLTITCVSPFFDADGKFAGCVAMDVLIKDLNESMVSDGIVDPTFATLIDKTGKFVAGRYVDPLAEEMGSIFDEDTDASLRSVGKEILEKKEGVVRVGEGEEAEYIAFSTIHSTEWTICILSPVSTVIQPAVAIRESINENTSNVVDSVNKGILTVIQSCLLLSALIIIFVLVFAGKMSRRISDPLKQLETDVRRISGGNLDSHTDVKTDDEIGSLASSFNFMADSLRKYIADLKEVTAKEERIASELSVAKEIQYSMLPSNFDDFEGHKEFDLYATMDPAKEVGGDFYDFFLVDDDHIALVMADVSGKGVPAAMFMAITKTLIKNRVQMGDSPADALKNVNEQLCQGNEAELFVTVWLAVIDLATGKGLAANAGHEHPVICRADGVFELIKYRHSPAVATMEGIRFKEHEFELRPGDRLFVYTDGVPEATNAASELFGADRMVDSLNRDPSASPRTLLANLRADIDAFVGEAPQFDDITMMEFTFSGRPNDTAEKSADELTLDATDENLHAALAFIDERLEALDCSPAVQMQIDVAVEELFVNVAHYAYAPNVGQVTVRFETADDPRRAVITLIDGGVPYDPLAKPDPDVTLSAEERPIGGLGIYMVKKSMDAMRYEYRDEKNVLTIEKNL